MRRSFRAGVRSSNAIVHSGLVPPSYSLKKVGMEEYVGQGLNMKFCVFFFWNVHDKGEDQLSKQ